MDRLLQDLRHAFRALRARPGFTLVAALSIAVGIGANTAIFSVVNTLLLRPLPGVSQHERVVDLGRAHPRYGGHDSFSWPDLQDIDAGVAALEATAGYRMDPVSVSREDAGEVVMGAFVTPSFFPVLGVTAERGRLLAPQESDGVGAHPVAVLGHEFWRDRMGADPAVVGREILVNRQPYTVVGVAERGFRGTMVGMRVDVFLPMVQFPALNEGRSFFDRRGASWFQALGLMAPGADLAQVNTQLDAVAQRLAQAYPETNAERIFRALPLGPIPGGGREVARTFLLVLMGLVGIILLVTCANVAGMFVARALSREREIAIRLALGAGRAGLVRHLLVEGLLVFLLGGAVGVALAWWGVAGIPVDRLPLPVDVVELDFSPDLRVLGFASLATLLTGVVFGLLPALGASRLELVPSLKAEGTGGVRRQGLRRLFVAGQLGLTLVLVVGAGLFVRSLQEAGRLSRGFDPAGTYMTQMDLRLDGYGPEEGRLLQERILERIQELPGTRGAALALDLPLDLSSHGTAAYPVAWPEARTEREGRVGIGLNTVTEGYFRTLEIPVLEGRVFQPGDREGAPRVVVVSRTFAERVSPDASPVGQRIRVGSEDAEPATIVGVVEDVRNSVVFEDPEPFVYTPLGQDYRSAMQALVDADGEGEGLPGALRAALLEVDPGLALGPVVSVERYTSLGLLPHRVAAGVTSGLGALALLLSALGIYGVLATLVAHRTREIGVRMALGAGSVRVVGLVARRLLALALPGLMAGALLSWGLARLLESQGFLIGLRPDDPWMLAATALLLASVVSAAALVPARRAASVEPARALRSE